MPEFSSFAASLCAQYRNAALRNPVNAADSSHCRKRATKDSRGSAIPPAISKGWRHPMAEVAWFENVLGRFQSNRSRKSPPAIRHRHRPASAITAPSSSRTRIWARAAARPRRWPISWRTMSATRCFWSATSSTAGSSSAAGTGPSAKPGGGRNPAQGRCRHAGDLRARQS